jgi:hypothetical protein
MAEYTVLNWYIFRLYLIQYEPFELQIEFLVLIFPSWLTNDLSAPLRDKCLIAFIWVICAVILSRLEDSWSLLSALCSAAAVLHSSVLLNWSSILASTAYRNFPWKTLDLSPYCAISSLANWFLHLMVQPCSHVKSLTVHGLSLVSEAQYWDFRWFCLNCISAVLGVSSVP